MAEQTSSQGTEVNKNSTSYTSVVSPQKKKKKKKRRKRKKRKIKKMSGARLMPSGLFCLSCLKSSILYRSGARLFFINTMFYRNPPVFDTNSVDSYQKLHSAASDLGLHCLPMSL